MDIPSNVRDFMDKCALEVCKEKYDTHRCDLWNFIEDTEIKSPIEQLMYCALDTIRELNFYDYLEHTITCNYEDVNRGFGVSPQHKIGKYRCDFLVRYESRDISNAVIVECDSQTFHERSEQERRYEKARDRYFIKEGYKVFHYTGSEIFADPMKVASEIFSYVVNQPIDNIMIESNFAGNIGV